MRKLIAALACRNEGARLYGKPLQNLDIQAGITILDQIVACLRRIHCIDEIVLGISDGNHNLAYVDYAKSEELDFIIGDEKDVLSRLIQCGRKAQGTDIFRVTTESPFFYYEMADEAWRRHVDSGNDVTSTDGLPEGCNIEIYTIEALEKSHKFGDNRHRSEYCSLYIREHRGDFKVETLPIPSELERLDLRLTVDYPEDLVLCRHVYAHLKHKAPKLPIIEIIEFIDNHPELKKLDEPYVVKQRLW